MMQANKKEALFFGGEPGSISIKGVYKIVSQLLLQPVFPSSHFPFKLALYANVPKNHHFSSHKDSRN